MKKQLLPLLALVFVLVTAASCSSSRNTSSSRNPSGTGTKGQRTSESFPDILFPGTKAATTRGMPPGQAKKVYGDQSARAYAPGQQKKAGMVTPGAPGNSKGKKGKGKGKKK